MQLRLASSFEANVSNKNPMRKHPLGIYEKALPPNLTWAQRLAMAKVCGFDFVEVSIDESDVRLKRLAGRAANVLIWSGPSSKAVYAYQRCAFWPSAFSIRKP